MTDLKKFFDDMENWVCPKCGERANCHFGDGNWRWTGTAWEHSHGYPIGHVPAEYRPEKGETNGRP